MRATVAADWVKVHRVRLREVAPVGLKVARNVESEARGILGADGQWKRQLRQVEAICPPRPLRLPFLVGMTLLTLLIVPSRVGRTRRDVATVSHIPASGPGRGGWYLRMLVAVLAALGALVVWGVACTAVTARSEAAGRLLFAWSAVVMLPVVAAAAWPIKAAYRDRASNKLLRTARAQAIRNAPGPVHVAYGLASGNKGAGRALVWALLHDADEAGVTVIARTEEGLIGLYKWFGFSEVARAPTSWGTAVLFVRRPGQRRRRREPRLPAR